MLVVNRFLSITVNPVKLTVAEKMMAKLKTQTTLICAITINLVS